jgi:tetratricopeptide (TPR) repeat protein
MKNSDKKRAAIEAAMLSNWPKAVELNLDLLKENQQDVEALNRLAQAYWQSRNLKKAFTAYQKVIRIEPYNPIAGKALERLKSIKKATVGIRSNSAECFLKEPGKTKTVRLVNVAKAELLCQLNSAESLKMVPKKHRIAIMTEGGDYLGILPDDLSHRLLILLKGGNRYQACVKTVDCQNLEVFIRETFRSKKFRNQPSFVHLNE